MATPLRRPRAPLLIRPVANAATVPPPLDGPWTPIDARIDHAERLPLPGGRGPEDVCVDPAGRLLTGGDDGRIWRRDDTGFHLLTDTGGRPLGIEVDPTDGSLIVCDAYRGLLRVYDDGRIIDLADRAAGTPILFCNNAAVAADGTVYFTDSSSRFPLSAWRSDLLEYRPNGRLLAYRNGTVDVVADQLYFPNGVALSADGSALVVAETSAHRLLVVPLSGGSPRELVDLPAYPDNVSSAADGSFWVALPSLRSPQLERFLPKPGIRRMAALLPDRLQPQPSPHSLVANVTLDGVVRRSLHAPTGRYRMITGVRQQGDTLWLGSLHESAVGRVSLARAV